MWETILQIFSQMVFFVLHVVNSGSFPKPLTAAQERQALTDMRAGDKQARGLLIEHNLRLVAHIIKKYYANNREQEDLVSIGTIGLIKAVDTFDETKGPRLATYASRCIENEILMYLRKVSSQKTEVSFDEPLNTDWDGNELLLSDVLGTDGDEVSRPLEDTVEKELLMQAVSRLGERERNIIILRFGLCGKNEYTQKEVADMLGISQSYISRLEKRIISRLRRDMQKMLQIHL